MILRDYQSAMVADIRAAWAAGKKNVLATLPTGGGKTVIFSHLLAQETAPAIAIAHRQELVSQICLALARFGVPHGIIAPRETIREIVTVCTTEIGSNFYNAGARVQVAGIDTLNARADKLRQRLERVGLWVMDEGHHILTSNKWGKALDLFPHGRGLGVTATPERADGRGLGRHADGVMDVLIGGPSMADLRDMGYLSPYRILAPPNDLDVSAVPVSAATGDYIPIHLKRQVQKSHIIGDVVEHYIRHTPGKLGVTFATDLDTAVALAEEYRSAGVPAELVTGTTPTRLRAEIMRKFRNREIIQVVNVDLFGEGFDLPALEVVSMARPTKSYGLYCQIFGRALRPLPGKSEAWILDHVGNVSEHGLPDYGRPWTLDRRGRRKPSNPDIIPVRICQKCTAAYERIHPTCPYCGHHPVPAERSSPDHVDGDLTELDLDALRSLARERARISETYCEAAARLGRHLAGPALAGALKQHETRREAQEVLRDTLALWGSWRRHSGDGDPTAYRRFYLRYGTDVLTAQSLGAADALNLAAMVAGDMADRVVRADN